MENRRAAQARDPKTALANTVDIIVPCFNEEDSIDAFYDAVRQVTEEQIRFIQENADHYVKLSAQYMADGLSV